MKNQRLMSWDLATSNEPKKFQWRGASTIS
jgi:hypothetical protein